MVGLVTFQWYWIETGIRTKEEQFDRNVLEAMQATIRNIERQEVIFLAKQHLKIQEEEKTRLAAEARVKQIKTQFSAWDGSHNNLEIIHSKYTLFFYDLD